MVKNPLVIIGAGPAGLTAAYEATKHGQAPLVLEKAALVGGIARTESYKGFRFDMGGHRFFTKSPEVDQMWREVLSSDMLRRGRLSRIFYNSKFFSYPLKPFNALAGLGIFESCLILCSYIRWKLFPHEVEDTFEQWVTNRFGKRLFLTFFKTYTEKVWGISCTELKAEWAAQRIKDLSLRTAVLSMFLRPAKTIKTLIDSFDYPRLGPGMLWEAVRREVETRGGTIRQDSDVTKICRNGNCIESVVLNNNGHSEIVRGDHFITSMPVTEFIRKLDPPAPTNVRQAAGKLKYRDFLTVCVIVDKPDLFPDNWIYIHDPTVQVGRIQNFKNWSPDMVPDQSKTSLGLEYFCNEGDALWTMSDADLVLLARAELQKIGLAQSNDVIDGCVFRVPKSYPVYDSDYTIYLKTVRSFMDGLENCRTIGRNGLHRYNNQDHSMLTGMYAVRNLLLGQNYALWDVNADKEYHEEQQLTPALEEHLAVMFARMDSLAMGLSCGIICAVGLWAMTMLLVLKGGHVVGPHLALLGQFFPGYRVTPLGSVLGLFYGSTVGFVGGFSLSALRNVVLFAHWAIVRRRAERNSLKHLLEYV
jgi:protoporphyrinogen oxidase